MPLSPSNDVPPFCTEFLYKFRANLSQYSLCNSVSFTSFYYYTWSFYQFHSIAVIVAVPIFFFFFLLYLIPFLALVFFPFCSIILAILGYFLHILALPCSFNRKINRNKNINKKIIIINLKNFVKKLQN